MSPKRDWTEPAAGGGRRRPNAEAQVLLKWAGVVALSGVGLLCLALALYLYQSGWMGAGQDDAGAQQTNRTGTHWYSVPEAGAQPTTWQERSSETEPNYVQAVVDFASERVFLVGTVIILAALGFLRWIVRAHK